MLLRIRREIFRTGEFEEYYEEGALTRDEICDKYHLSKNATFIGSDGKVIEGDIIHGATVTAAEMPASATATAITLFSLAGLAILGGWTYILSQSFKISSPKISYGYSLRGATNPIRKSGGVGLLLGRYDVPSDVAAMTYSTYKDDDQYIHQLFCNGYAKNNSTDPNKQSGVVIEVDEKFKKDGVNDEGLVVHMGDSPIDVYKDLRIASGAGVNALYTKRCIEDSLSMQLKEIGLNILDDAYVITPPPNQFGHVEITIPKDNWGMVTPIDNVGVERTTATNTKTAHVSICAPYGYYALTDKGAYTENLMVWAVFYRKHGTSDPWTCAEVFCKYFHTTKFRKMVDIDFPTVGQYDVLVARGANADKKEDTKVFGSYMWEFLQSDTVGRDNSTKPVTSPDKYSLLAIEVRATDQLNGYLDQIIATCHLKCRTLDPAIGGAPRAEQWKIPADTSKVGTMNNPASILLYLLTDKNANPRAVDDSLIDWISLREWWLFCNEREWSVNAWIAEPVTVGELVKNVCMAGRAQFRMNDGKYGVIIEDRKKNDAVSQMFTPRNAWEMTESKSFVKQPTIASVEFLNEETGVEESRYVKYHPETNSFTYDDEISQAEEDSQEVESFEVWGVTNADQVTDLAMYRLAGLHALTRTYSWTCGVDSIYSAVGDVVYLANDLFLYSLGYGRIISEVKDGNGSITGIVVDETMGLDTTKRYGVTIRRDDGTFTQRAIDQNTSKDNTLMFTDTITGVSDRAILEGNLFMYGEGEGKKVVIQEMKPGENHTVTITAVDYVPEIYDVDKTHKAPPYKSNISQYGSGASFGQGSVRPELDTPTVVPPPAPMLVLKLTGLVYRYNDMGELNPPNQSIVASVAASSLTSPLVWTINGAVVPDYHAESLLIGPEYMRGRDYIEVGVSSSGLSASNSIVRIRDGKDYIPIVQYRYSSDYNSPNADNLRLVYGEYVLTYGQDVLMYGAEPWTDYIPVGEKYKGMYLWKRTWSYEHERWNYELISGQSGDTIRTSFEYGLSTSPVDCTVEQWSDTMPQWYMGYYIWYRNRYTNLTTGEVTYDGVVYYDKAQTESLMASSRFSFTASSAGYVVNRRSAENNSITLTLDIEGYNLTEDDITWATVPTMTLTGNVLTIPYNTEADSVEVTMSAVNMGVPVKHKEVLTAKDETPLAAYLGTFASDPVTTPYGDLLEGDYYLRKNVSGDTSDILLMVYTGGAWRQLLPSDEDYNRKVLDMMPDVFKDVDKNHIGTAAYDFFKSIVAENITAEMIGAMFIEVFGAIYGGIYNKDGTVKESTTADGGFHLGAEGNMKASNVELDGSISVDHTYVKKGVYRMDRFYPEEF